MSTTTWWQDLYDDWLAEMLLVRGSAEEVDDTVRFLIERLGLAPGARVFDQCCGIGSLSLPLARRGFRVVGVDQSEGYIERGLRDAAAEGLKVEMHAGDAMAFVPSAPVDGAFNWWTSFGYSLDDQANGKMLRRAFEALVPGGRFLLDFMNVPGVLRNFERHHILRRSTPQGEVLLLRESAIDLERGTMEKNWTYLLPDGRRQSRPSSVRLYMPHEVAMLLAAVGFSEVEMYGDTQGGWLSLDSPRLILRARRPA